MAGNETSHLDASAILGLLRLPKVGDSTVHRILETLREQETDVRFLTEYEEDDLVAEGLLTPAQAELFSSEAEREWRAVMMETLEQTDVRLLPITDPRYPAHLRDEPPGPPPPLLTVIGDEDVLAHTGVAFAGDRSASEIGLEITRSLVAQAVASRFPVVSGGARGTDLATHEEAARCDGMTVVVLAEGILTGRAQVLAQAFADARIAIVSPFLPDQSWQAWTAMQRNRTILGLCDRLVVIEAGARGGTLSAGQEALRHAIPTWALDYPEPPLSAEGNRLLLEAGAKPIPVSEAGEVETPPELFAIHDWLVNVVE